MGREIKFRAWDKKRKRMYEVLHLHTEQYPFSDGIWATVRGYDIIEQKDIHLKIQPKDVEVMQYTGLRDKNGTEIYEGDIVKGHYYMNKQSHRIIGKVVYPYCYFCIDGVGQYSHIMRVDLDGSYEVIGNIYENADLLTNTVSE